MKLQENDFIMFPKLPISLRFLIDMILISIAFLLQSYQTTFFIILGFSVLLFFIFFNWVKRLDITKEFEGKTFKWENTNIEEVRAAYKKVKKIFSISTKPGSAFVYIAFFFFISFFIGPAILEFGNQLVFFLYLDAVVIGFVVYSSGNRYIWTPKGFKQKLQIFISSYEYIKKVWGEKYYPEPQFYLEEHQEKYVPHDIKLLVKTKYKPPKGFLAIQYQITINDVQGKKYPYFYSVIVTKKDFSLIKRFKEKEDIIKTYLGVGKKKLITRLKSEKDVEIIVIRQYTTKTYGYYTKKNAIRKTIDTSIKIWEELIKE